MGSTLDIRDSTTDVVDKITFSDSDANANYIVLGERFIVLETTAVGHEDIDNLIKALKKAKELKESL